MLTASVRCRLVIFIAFSSLLGMSQALVAAEAAPSQSADDLLKPQPRPARPALPPSALPLEFIDGERIALVGGSTAERMNLFGYFETLLHARFPNKELVFRNFARPADEVAIRQRPNDYTKLDDPLRAFGADTMLCFFGFNESFAGSDGVEKFQADYQRFLDDFAKRYPRDDSGAPPRFVLVSPMAFEPTGDRLLPDGSEENANLELYTQAVREVAQRRELAFVDVFTPTLARFTAEPGMQHTINGCHQNAAGDRELAIALDRRLFGSGNRVDLAEADFERLRAAVNDKAWHHQQDYRMVNGWYVYGGRRTWDTETFPREYVKLRNMVAVRDRYVWDIAQGETVSAAPDDGNTGELFVPQTRFGTPRQNYSEAEDLRYLTPDDFIASCTMPPGFELELFADETQFPELANPVQLSFDGRGRLWVSTMPTYPMWRPGDPKPDDKLLIFEDTDGDGRADDCKVFCDGLHCPTGFEFYGDGVLIVSQPRLLWVRDTDGDDRADTIVNFLDGFATDDTHHTIGAFEPSHGGKLYMMEGLAMSTTVETPWGPFRNFATPGGYVLDPHSLRLSHFVTPGYGNPWCCVFNEWGQAIVGDGTSAVQHWETPLSGKQFGGRQGLKPVFNNEGMRPCIGSEFLITRLFPDDVQGHFIYACVINMNGMPRFHVGDDGAGYSGHRLKQDGQPADLLRSTDKHFRPVDPQIGPDGALWFGDWSNALIGHMQYSQRDPNRDHQRGRLYRLVHRDGELIEPVTQYDKSTRDLFEQFRAPEWRTRQRARRELAQRPTDEVLAATSEFLASLDTSDPVHDRLLSEALWVQQTHHSVDPQLLERVLSAETYEARAAGTRVVADERHLLSGTFETLVRMSQDEHSRVRTEAIRGLSYSPTLEAAEALLATVSLPQDYWTEYTLEHALAANEAVWRQAFLSGQLAANNEAGQAMLLELLSASKLGGAAAPYLRTLLGQDSPTEEQRNKAIQALVDMKGNAGNGRQIFLRSCTACHKLGDQGREYGPDITEVAPKRTKYQLAQSIIDPNAEVDEKYVSTAIITNDGIAITGLVVSENDDELVIFDGKDPHTIAKIDIDERETLKQSSMPEGLAAALAPVEFLDVVEFLASLKQQ